MLTTPFWSLQSVHMYWNHMVPHKCEQLLCVNQKKGESDTVLVWRTEDRDRILVIEIMLKLQTSLRS